MTGLLTLPLAPVRGVLWLSEALLHAAEDELNSAQGVRAQLQQLDEDWEAGVIGADEYEQRWEALMDRLMRLSAGSTFGGIE